MEHVPHDPGERQARYWEAVKEQDRRLDELLLSIRAKQNAGEYTTLEGCQARVDALEQHLAEVRRLRQEHFGEQ